MHQMTRSSGGSNNCHNFKVVMNANLCNNCNVTKVRYVKKNFIVAGCLL